ncbi:MAG: hypothetical protein WC299_05050 [Kiritimatiellia bacterium]
MNNMAPMLKEWAGRRAASKDELRRLAGRIAAMAPARIRRVHDRERLPCRLRFVQVCAAAAAAAIIAFFTVWHLADMGSALKGEDVFAKIVFTGGQITEGRRLFGEYERLFFSQLRWLAECDGEIKLGVAPVPEKALGAEAPLYYRLVVVSRKHGKGAWRPVWSTDILLRPQELVRLTPGCRDKSSVALWIYPFADGKVMIDANMSLDIGRGITYRTSDILSLGKPGEVTAMRFEDREYRVFQTVILPGRAS